MHLKHWIETCLKRKNWTIQKLKEEIDNIKQDEEYKLHIKKINEIERKNIPDKDKRELINREKNNFSSNSDKAGIGLSTISRILNSREKCPSERTIKKIESVLGSFRLFLEEEVYNRSIYHKGICFEEKHTRDILTEDRKKNKYIPIICESCACPLYREESFQTLIISTKNDKAPISWTKETIKKTDYPQFPIRLCNQCRNDLYFLLKMPYSELLRLIITHHGLKQKEIASKINTTQSTIFKILNERIEYIKIPLAKKIQKLALKCLTEEYNIDLSTPFFTKGFYTTLNEKIEEQLFESASCTQRQCLNKSIERNETIKIRKGDVKVTVEQKKKFIAQIVTKDEKSIENSIVCCDFFIEYFFSSTYSENRRFHRIMAFIINHKYSEGCEKNYLDYFLPYKYGKANILCLMPIHDLIKNEYQNPLNDCHFFQFKNEKLIGTSYQNLFDFIDY